MEYAIKRQEELGGPIELSEMPTPLIFGEIKHIANGPAKCFLNLVNDFSWDEGTPDRTQLARIVKHNYENKIPNDLKDIYRSCYEKTLQNLDNDKIELQLLERWLQDLLCLIYLTNRVRLPFLFRIGLSMNSKEVLNSLCK